MKIGFIGLGSVGLPCVVAVAMKGHDVMGCDVVAGLMNKKPRLYQESGPDGKEAFAPYLEAANIRFGALEEVVARSDIVFVAVQTLHEPRYEGVTRLPRERMDFDYRYLVRAIEEISAAVKRETTVAIVLTVLPGTMRRSIRPFLYDPYVEGAQRDLSKLAPHVFLIGAKHPEFTSLTFAKGSVVIDRWRYLAPQDGVRLISVGIGKAA